MLNLEQAQAVAENHLQTLSARSGHDLVLHGEYTREEDFGWVFFFNTRAYVETGDINDALGGNGPLLVDAKSGKLLEAGTAHPTEHYVAVYKRDGNLDRAHE